MLNEVAPIRAKAPMNLDPPSSWMEDAPCIGIGVELFFPENDSSHDNTRAAKRVCEECPVAVECRIAGMLEEYGIWGGLDATERKRIRARVPQWSKYNRSSGHVDDYEAKRLRTMVRKAQDTAEIIEGLPKEVRSQPFVLDMRVRHWTDGF